MTHAQQLPTDDPTLAHARVRQVIRIGLACSVVNLVWWDACPWLPLVALGAWLGAAWSEHQSTRERTRQARELERPRSFALDAAALPGATPDDDATWHPQWVPFLLVRMPTVADVAQAPGGVEVGPWRKVLQASPAWRAVLDAQRHWLCIHAQPRWQVVARWWRQWHVEAWQRRLGNLAQAQAACSVELLCGISLAGDPTLWDRRVGFGDEAEAYAALARELSALPQRGLSAPSQASSLPAFPRHRARARSQLYLGEGFRWEGSHTQQLDDLRRSTLTQAPSEQGDPRVFGIGAAQARARFLPEAQFNQMAGIFGATGVGKTRFAEVLLVQVIHSNLPLVVIDPKGDQALTNRVLETCRLAGRGHQFRYFSLAAPRRPGTWRYLSRYNPCAAYTDPAELAARISSVLPATRDPFWTNVAKAMVETCLTLAHWMHWYLRFIDRGADGVLASGTSARVPDLLLALQWARHHPEASPLQAASAVSQIRHHLQDPRWTPPDAAAREVVAALRLRSSNGTPLYSPLEWLPTVRHVQEYEIDNTVAFLGWVLKIVYPHLYLDSERLAAPDLPRQASTSELLGHGAGPAHGAGGLGGQAFSEGSAWSRYLGAAAHPLELRLDPSHPAPPALARVVAFYDHFVPHRAGDHEDLTRLFSQLRRNLEAHYSDCTKERQKFLEYATTLQSALKPFLGERARILCAAESDLSWQQVVDERQVVYCGLSSMIDDQAATACAKMIVHDLQACFGRRYQYQGGEAAPIYLFADEIGSFINEPFIQLLNKCRGVGLRAIIAGQCRADLTRCLGRDGAAQVLANLNSVFQLRSPLPEDARDFSARAGEAKIVQESRNASHAPQQVDLGAHLGGGFTVQEGHGYSARQVALVPADALMALPRGQAFLHSQGQVHLLAQGLLPAVVTDLFAEIGLHPGTMREAVEPPRSPPAAPAGLSAARAQLISAPSSAERLALAASAPESGPSAHAAEPAGDATAPNPWGLSDDPSPDLDPPP